MSADREVTRIVRSWLEEGVTALPDRVLDAVLDQVPATRQRRPRRPAWRVFDMNAPIRLAIGLAAVLAAAVIGLKFLPNGSGVGGGPTTTPTPTPTPIPLPIGTKQVPLGGPGTYVAGAPFPISVTLKLPAGWSGNVGGPYAIWLSKTAGGGSAGDTGRGAVALTLSQRLYADPCSNASLVPQPGPTVDDLASALARLPGFDVTSVTEVTMDGYLGKQLGLTAPADFSGCTASSGGSSDFQYGLFQLPLGAVYAFSPGQRTTLAILDVHGTRLVVSSDTYPTTTTQDQVEIQAILNSIRIESPS